MNKPDLARWLAGHRNPVPARVVAICAGKETPLRVQGGSHRWLRAAALLGELGAEAVRLYDSENELLDSAVLDDVDGAQQGAADVAPATSSPSSSSSAPITSLGFISSADLVRIIGAFTENITRVVRETTASQASAHSSAFKELTRVTEIATQRLISLEQFVQSSLAERAAELEQREAVVRDEEEAETAMEKIMEHVGPKLADKFAAKMLDKGTNGAANGSRNKD